MILVEGLECQRLPTGEICYMTPGVEIDKVQGAMISGNGDFWLITVDKDTYRTRTRPITKVEE